MPKRCLVTVVVEIVYEITWWRTPRARGASLPLSVVSCRHEHGVLSSAGENPSQFCYLHSLAVDSHGDVYAAEVSFVEVGRLQRPAREMSSLRKWAHNDPK